MTIQQIKEIGNYYGGLSIKFEDGKYFWSIENWDGHNWVEISETLYNNLLEYCEGQSNEL